MTEFSQITVISTNAEMWTQYEQFPEMAVRKDRSRPSPGFVFQVRGLDPTTKYKMSMKLCAKDNFKYKYGPVDEEGVQKDKWYPTSEYGTHQQPQLVDHHWGVQTGEFWMERGVKFLQLFLCTIPNEDSFVVETMRLYYASLVIANTENMQVMTVPMDILKFVTVSSYRNQYKKPTEKLPRAHRTPPVREQGSSSGTAGASQTPKSRGLKKRQSAETSNVVNASPEKKQKVHGVLNVYHHNYYASEVEDAYVMHQQYPGLGGYFAGDAFGYGYQPEFEFYQAAQDSFQYRTQQPRFQGYREFSPEVDSEFYQHDFDYKRYNEVTTPETSEAEIDFQMSPITDYTQQSDVYAAAREDFKTPPANESTNDFEYFQQENKDFYDLDSPQLWNTSSPSAQAGEAPESNGNHEVAVDEYDILQHEISNGLPMFKVEFWDTVDDV